MDLVSAELRIFRTIVRHSNTIWSNQKDHPPAKEFSQPILDNVLCKYVSSTFNLCLVNAQQLSWMDTGSLHCVPPLAAKDSNLTLTNGTIRTNSRPTDRPRLNCACGHKHQHNPSPVARGDQLVPPYAIPLVLPTMYCTGVPPSPFHHPVRTVTKMTPQSPASEHPAAAIRALFHTLL